MQTVEGLHEKLNDHIKDTNDRFHEGEKNFDKLNRVLFGDKQTGERGMSDKVTDIHQRITQVDGVGSFLKWVIVIGGVLSVLKFWIFSK